MFLLHKPNLCHGNMVRKLQTCIGGFKEQTLCVNKLHFNSDNSYRGMSTELDYLKQTAAISSVIKSSRSA